MANAIMCVSLAFSGVRITGAKNLYILDCFVFVLILLQMAVEETYTQIEITLIFANVTNCASTKCVLQKVQAEPGGRNQACNVYREHIYNKSHIFVNKFNATYVEKHWEIIDSGGKVVCGKHFTFQQISVLRTSFYMLISCILQINSIFSHLQSRVDIY